MHVTSPDLFYQESDQPKRLLLNNLTNTSNVLSSSKHSSAKKNLTTYIDRYQYHKATRHIISTTSQSLYDDKIHAPNALITEISEILKEKHISYVCVRMLLLLLNKNISTT